MELNAALPLVFATLLAFGGAAWPQEKGKPRDDVDAAETLSAVVRVKAKALPNARSSATLGPGRRGSGVLVRDGYVATIGYLVIESEAIEVTGADGKSVPAALAAYDHGTGFGLLRLLAPLAGKPPPARDSDGA